MVIPDVNHANNDDSISDDEAGIFIPGKSKRVPRLRLKAFEVSLDKVQMEIAQTEYSKRRDLQFLSLTEFASFFFSSDPGLMERERVAICIEFMVYREIHHSPPLVEFYTGLPDSAAFCDVNRMLQMSIFRDYIKWEFYEKQDFMTHTLMTLMKLRLNMPDEELAERFKVDLYVVNMTLRLWIPAMHKSLYTTCEGLYRYPRPFRTENYTKIIDIVEICVETPEYTKELRDGCHETRRAVMAVRADGYFCFGSDVFGQYVPEDVCLRRSKFRGSTTVIDVVLTHPELLNVLMSSKINCRSITDEACEQIEMTTDRISDFKILGAIPLEYSSYSSFIFKICGALSNFSLSVLNEEDNEEDDEV